jgi:hypothetical protein
MGFVVGLLRTPKAGGSEFAISDKFPTSVMLCCALWGESATNAVFKLLYINYL